MIRIAVVDDHEAIRAGLKALFDAEPGFEPVGSASEAAGLQSLLYRTRPDVVVLDYHLPDADGITLCRQIKACVPAPAVILYSAYAYPELADPALNAGADGLVHKGASSRELVDAVRAVAGGGSSFRPLAA